MDKDILPCNLYLHHPPTHNYPSKHPSVCSSIFLLAQEQHHIAYSFLNLFSGEPEVRKTRDLRFSLDLLFLSGAGPFVSLDLSFLTCEMGSMDQVILQGPIIIAFCALSNCSCSSRVHSVHSFPLSPPLPLHRFFLLFLSLFFLLSSPPLSPSPFHFLPLCFTVYLQLFFLPSSSSSSLVPLSSRSHPLLPRLSVEFHTRLHRRDQSETALPSAYLCSK